MGFQVRRRYDRQDGSIVWRVIHERAGTDARSVRHVAKKEYGRLGFCPKMSFDEARAHAQALSSEAEKVRRERGASKFRARRAALLARVPDLLPEVFVTAFETSILRDAVCWGEECAHLQQLLKFWRVVQDMIARLVIPPAEWSERRNAIYSYFAKPERRWSLSYAHKLIRVLNLYGRFYSRQTKSFYEDVPRPTREAAVRINARYYEKRPRGLASEPLCQEVLARARKHLDAEEWNWLYVSMWLGLRPTEIGRLETGRLEWKIEMVDGRRILAVMQPKLYKSPPDQRWKFIPLLFHEQERALGLIERKAFRAPKVRRLQRALGKGYSLRGGRKGFIALMWERGRVPKAVSHRWLGHRSERTSTEHYSQRLKLALEFDIEPKKTKPKRKR